MYLIDTYDVKKSISIEVGQGDKKHFLLITIDQKDDAENQREQSSPQIFQSDQSQFLPPPYRFLT